MIPSAVQSCGQSLKYTSRYDTLTTTHPLWLHTPHRCRYQAPLLGWLHGIKATASFKDPGPMVGKIHEILACQNAGLWAIPTCFHRC